jgi:hypothetical protein
MDRINPCAAAGFTLPRYSVSRRLAWIAVASESKERCSAGSLGSTVVPRPTWLVMRISPPDCLTKQGQAQSRSSPSS